MADLWGDFGWDAFQPDDASAKQRAKRSFKDKRVSALDPRRQAIYLRTVIDQEGQGLCQHDCPHGKLCAYRAGSQRGRPFMTAVLNHLWEGGEGSFGKRQKDHMAALRRYIGKYCARLTADGDGGDVIELNYTLQNLLPPPPLPELGCNAEVHCASR